MKTVDNILRRMREFADEAERGDCYDLRALSTDSFRAYADIIEKAVKHQFRDTTKTMPEKVVVAKMETTTPTCEKYSQVGNAAAMREALEKVRFYMPHFLQYMRLHREDDEAGGYYERILEVVNAALSSPPRNCDVGTAEEQAERFDRWCDRKSIKDCWGVGCRKCIIAWSQMPYEEGGAE